MTYAQFQSLLFGAPDQKAPDVGLVALGLTLLASLMASLLWAWIYNRFYGARSTGSRIHRAFPLIGVATTAIFLCVQFSLPMSLGLLGSLSIVRFRTPIKEAEEIGFIMLVIASSLCCGAFYLALLPLMFAAAVAALLLLRWRPGFLSTASHGGSLVVRCPVTSYEPHATQVESLIAAHLSGHRLDSVNSQGGEYTLTWSFQSVTAEQSTVLESALRTTLPAAAIGLYFHSALHD